MNEDEFAPIEPGWYLPVGPAPEGFWNPYYLDAEGNWFEAQREGHIEVSGDEIAWPIARLVFDPKWSAQPESVSTPKDADT